MYTAPRLSSARLQKSDKGDMPVGVFDLIDRSLSFVRFVLVCNFGQQVS